MILVYRDTYLSILCCDGSASGGIYKAALHRALGTALSGSRGWGIGRGTKKPDLCPGKEGCRLRRCWWADTPPSSVGSVPGWVKQRQGNQLR